MRGTKIWLIGILMLLFQMGPAMADDIHAILLTCTISNAVSSGVRKSDTETHKYDITEDRVLQDGRKLSLMDIKINGNKIRYREAFMVPNGFEPIAYGVTDIDLDTGLYTDSFVLYLHPDGQIEWSGTCKTDPPRRHS